MAIIPFGKHKGRLVEELLETDPNYLEWLQAQPWFREQFTALYQIIINHGPANQDTPEHNALQCLFLDDKFCRAFLQQLTNGVLIHRVYDKKFEERGVDVEFKSKIEASQTGWFHEIKGYEWRLDSSLRGQYEQGPTVAIEIKPTVGDDYPAVLRQMRANGSRVLFLEQYTGTGATLEQFIQTFNLSGFAVVFKHEVTP